MSAPAAEEQGVECLGKGTSGLEQPGYTGDEEQEEICPLFLEKEYILGQSLLM